MLASSCLFLDAADTDQTKAPNGLHNGRLWKLFNEEHRVFWIMAIEETAILVANAVADQNSPEIKAMEAMFYTRTTPTKELIEKIDLVYQDPINLIIPIVQVYSLCCREFNGDIKGDVEFQKELAENREANRR